MKSSKSKVSVIIPTYNSWTTLKPCIESIYEQSLKPAEIIVVDNGSSDKTHQNLRKYFPKVKGVNLKENTGVTGGRNAGINRANKGSDYLLFFDHDMEADKGMLENLVRVAEESKNIGITTPKIFYDDDKTRVWAAGTNINLWTGQILFRGGKDKGQFDRDEEVQVAPAAMLVKNSALKAVSGFDNRYFATYEDTDFCFRAKRFGFKTVYIAGAIAYHKISSNKVLEQKRLLDRAFWVGRNRIIFMGDFGKNFYVFMFFLPVYLIYYIKLAYSRKDLKGLINYIRGVRTGIIEELLRRRLLMHMPYTLYNVLLEDIGEEEKTILEVGCGDGRLMKILNADKSWKVIGIDEDRMNVQLALQQGVYEDVRVGDIKKVGKIFQNKEFDVVLVSNVLESLKKGDALQLIKDCQKLGRKVILSGLSRNWGIENFKKGYILRGFGVSWILGRYRVKEWKIWDRDKNLRTVKFIAELLERLLFYLLSPIPYHFPKTAGMLLVIKDRVKKD